MLYLRNQPPNLARYLPRFLQEDERFKATLAACSTEHEKYRLLLDEITNQFYIETATWGLADWERILDLKPDADDNYEQRRNRILLKLQGRQVSTLDFMARFCARYTVDKAAEIEEHNEENRFRVYLHGGASDLPGLREALETYKPAHLGYDICYTLYGDLFDDEYVSDGSDSDFWAASLFHLDDDVPYGIPIKADKHDGARIRGGTICRKAERIRDGTLARCGFDATAATQWGKHIDYIFRSDGKATRDGTLQHDGRLMRRGEKPWKIEYVGQMEELSVLVITLAKDGVAPFEDDLKDLLPHSRIIGRDGNGRHGRVNHPVDTDGELTITRSRQRNGYIRRDGGDINLHDGSMRRSGMFRRDGGGIKRRVDIISDRLSGAQSITRGKKEAPLYLKYPEIYDTYTGTEERGSGEALLLDGFEDNMAQRLLHGGTVQRIGSYTRGADRQTVYESGGIEIIRCKIRDGSIDRAGGWTLKRDSSLRHSGESTHDKGGNRRDTTRHLETM